MPVANFGEGSGQAPAAAAAVPAGWYPDPSGQAPQRYWDGAAWTGHTAPGTA